MQVQQKENFETQKQKVGNQWMNGISIWYWIQLVYHKPSVSLSFFFFVKVQFCLRYGKNKQTNCIYTSDQIIILILLAREELESCYSYS